MGLLPDIRNVMTNDALRRKEAEEAKRLFIEREKETNNRIDRHIALLLSKGRISGDEISQLARLNSVSEERIQERITKKKRLFLINFKIEELVRTGKTDPKYHGGLVKEFSLDPGKISDWIQNKEREKYKKIDACLRRCNQRGYVTREEISALSRLFLISTDNIVRRTRCVIKESGTPMQDRPEPLDKHRKNHCRQFENCREILPLRFPGCSPGVRSECPAGHHPRKRCRSSQNRSKRCQNNRKRDAGRALHLYLQDRREPQVIRSLPDPVPPSGTRCGYGCFGHQQKDPRRIPLHPDEKRAETRNGY